MLFNSFEFIFFFLPLTVFIFFWFGKYNTQLSCAWLSAASLFFYAWWNPIYVLLLLFSIAFNYTMGICITKLLVLKNSRLVNLTLFISVFLNIILLGYFKYFNFFVDVFNSSLGFSYQINTIILPLGISFFTFTQIAFLVDTSRRLASEYNFLHYVLFVTYFPHLIAGPVLHHREMMPQFKKKETYRLSYQCIAVGLTIFIIGLYKKVMLADEISKYVKPVFDAAQRGELVSFKESWGAALSYSLQLYFDFSGYSDMAIGISRMFGILLPLNFNSPYKATNIIDFWRRWHMTLSRFLRDYLYIPLGGNRKGVVRKHLNLMMTMILGGLWHGSGWTFIVWGGLHGIYLIINHLWHGIRKKLGQDISKSTIVGRMSGCFITFIAVVFAWVFFRAESLHSGLSITQSMLGLNGFGFTGRFQLSMIGKLLLIAWLLPNTQQIMVKNNPALSFYEKDIKSTFKWFQWQPNLVWMFIIFLFVFHVIMKGMKGENASEFLYFQF